MYFQTNVRKKLDRWVLKLPFVGWSERQVEEAEQNEPWTNRKYTWNVTYTKTLSPRCVLFSPETISTESDVHSTGLTVTWHLRVDIKPRRSLWGMWKEPRKCKRKGDSWVDGKWGWDESFGETNHPRSSLAKLSSSFQSVSAFC